MSHAELRHLEKFNAGFRGLMREIADTFPQDAVFARAKARAIAAIDLLPTSIINEVGPILMAYGKQIYAKSEQFFVENDYDREFKQATDSKKIESARYLLVKARSHILTLDPATKAQYFEQVTLLLDAYVDYLAALASKS
jgi:hypothetical protein